MGTGLGTSLRVCLGTQEHSPVHYPADDGGGRGGRCSLDNNHSHFILVEPGPPGKGDGQVELWLRLEKHISEQRTGYGGEPPGGHWGAWRRGGKDHRVGTGGGPGGRRPARPSLSPGACGRLEGELLARAVGTLCVGGGVTAALCPPGRPWPEPLAMGAGLWEENEARTFQRHAATRGQRCPQNGRPLPGALGRG